MESRIIERTTYWGKRLKLETGPDCYTDTDYFTVFRVCDRVLRIFNDHRVYPAAMSSGTPVVAAILRCSDSYSTYGKPTGKNHGYVLMPAHIVVNPRSGERRVEIDTDTRKAYSEPVGREKSRQHINTYNSIILEKA